MRRLGDLITAHVPALSETETRDTGQVIAQTRKQLVPRAADNFHYFAEVCIARRRPHLSDADAPQLHALSSRSASAR